jgi:hypothetical protein
VCLIRVLQICNIESFRSEHIYWRDFAKLIYWCNGSIINTELQRTSTVAILPSHAERDSISSLLHRWGYTSTRLFHLPRIASYSLRSTTYLSQGYGGYMVYILVVWKCVFTILVMVEGDVQFASGSCTRCLWMTYSLIMRDVSVNLLFASLYIFTSVHE